MSSRDASRAKAQRCARELEKYPHGDPRRAGITLEGILHGILSLDLPKPTPAKRAAPAPEQTTGQLDLPIGEPS